MALSVLRESLYVILTPSMMHCAHALNRQVYRTPALTPFFPDRSLPSLETNPIDIVVVRELPY